MLILTEDVTLAYLRSFAPPIEFVEIMENLLKRTEIPADAPMEEKRKYEDWITTQLRYAERAKGELAG